MTGSCCCSCSKAEDSALIVGLLSLARRLGKDPLLVQAAGGNISVKLPSERLLVKASGVRLEELSMKRGIASADLDALRRGLASLESLRSQAARMSAYTRLLTRSGKSPGARVSMETGFHAALSSTYVAHTHSVGSLLLGLLPEKIARKRIAQALGTRTRVGFIPACMPGLDLTLRIQTADRPTGDSGGTALWVLNNHGLVWAADTAQEILNLSEELERRLRADFKLRRYPMPRKAGLCRAQGSCALPADSAQGSWQELCFCAWPDFRMSTRPWFPDFAVYFDLWSRSSADLLVCGKRHILLRARTPQESRDKAEVAYAQALVSTLAAGRKTRLRPLPPAMVAAIKGLTLEKLRMRSTP
ncbi:MAG: class II aldolase/adducin family protein [Elusimicrobiota bacterium]|jgi:ribulose-5-phosphate 4-epimerase/fuculose-1-phosphate aldolase